MPNVRLFVLSNRRDLLDAAPADPHFHKVDLNALAASLVPYHSNLLGEGRAFLADLDPGDAAYVGCVNARWDHKYTNIKTRLSGLLPFLADRLDPSLVFAPWPTNAGWLNYGSAWHRLTLEVHPSMERLLKELASFTGMKLDSGRVSFWANDFICARQVWLDWREHWRRCFRHFHGRYGYQLPLTFHNLDVSRQPAYFYERVTTMYFANRADVAVTPIP